LGADHLPATLSAILRVEEAVMMADGTGHGLERFVEAQDRVVTMSGRSVYSHALEELQQGRKRTHWMWFVLPQIAGLGSSDMSRFYAIASLEEAKAYLAHPKLGARMRQCIQAVLDVEGRNAAEIFGGIDAAKFCSCLTLFEAADPDEPLLSAALEKFYTGERDAATLRLIGAG
jgi:uncharacterized protein (DUF1810 family)